MTVDFNSKMGILDLKDVTLNYTQFPLIRDSADFRLVCLKKFPEF